MTPLLATQAGRLAFARRWIATRALPPSTRLLAIWPEDPPGHQWGLPRGVTRTGARLWRWTLEGEGLTARAHRDALLFALAHAPSSTVALLPHRRSFIADVHLAASGTSARPVDEWTKALALALWRSADDESQRWHPLAPRELAAAMHETWCVVALCELVAGLGPLATQDECRALAPALVDELLAELARGEVAP